MKRKVALGSLFTVGLLIDQFTKFLVQTNMKLYEVIEVIPNFFNIVYVLNPGAAFGIFRNQSPEVRKFFLVGITLVACVLFSYMLVKEYRFKLRSFAYISVLAGALGNVIDRIKMGHVVDFLDFYVKDFHWYIFNIADCFVTVGIALLIIDMVFINPQKKVKKG